MAASTAQGVIDPTKVGKYPVVLSDALLGKPSKESFTGVRYNHKPTLSSDIAPSNARLKQSSKDGSFNLGFDDKGDRYTFNGARTTNDGQYALVFDPDREVLVLHRLDSLFHMNVTRTPANSDANALRKQFPQLEISQPSGSSSGSSSAPGNKRQKSPDKAAGRSTAATKAKDKPTSALRNPKDTARKPEKEKTVSLTLPDPAKAAPPKPRARAPASEDEDEDDEDDGGLTIEYPGGEPPSTDFSPAFPAQMIGRRFSDFVRDGGAEQQDDDEDADADAELEDDAVGEEEEEEEEDDDDNGGGGAAVHAGEGAHALSSPVHYAEQEQPNGLGLQQYGEQQPYAPAAYGSGEDADADLEADLEAELEREFQKASGMDIDSESSVSEED